MDYIWAATRENLSSEVCEQQRRRPACASAQPDQCPFYSRFGKYHIYTSIFLLVSVAKETGLSLAFNGNPKDAMRPIYRAGLLFSCKISHLY